MKNSETLSPTPASFLRAGEHKAPAPRFPDRPSVGNWPVATATEEVLVVDDRSRRSPAQMVEDKLTRMLKEASMPASHLQMRGLLRSR